jgi:hypothetical protein
LTSSVRLSFERLVQTKWDDSRARGRHRHARNRRARPLDLDNARQIGQLTGAERRGNRLFERNDGDAFKGSWTWQCLGKVAQCRQSTRLPDL